MLDGETEYHRICAEKILDFFFFFFFDLEKEKAPQTWTVFFPCGNALMCSLGLSYRRLEDIRVFED